LIGHILRADNVHQVSVLVGDFHAEIGFIRPLVVIQELSCNVRCLLDRGSDIGELVTLAIPRQHYPVEHMEKAAGHGRVTISCDQRSTPANDRKAIGVAEKWHAHQGVAGFARKRQHRLGEQDGRPTDRKM